MCDMSNSRKAFVWVLVILTGQSRASPQLDLPQYEPNSGNYPQNPSFVPNPNYSPYNAQNGLYPKQDINPQTNSEAERDYKGIGKAYRGDVRSLLQALELQASQQCTNNVAAQWNFETNVNQATQLEALQAQQTYSEFQHAVWELLTHAENLNSIPDSRTFRQIRYYSVVGPAALSPDQLDRYNRLINDMLAIYNTASVCSFNDHFHCGLRLQPDLNTIMAKSRNWDELQHVWTEWRRQTGQKMKDLYEQMVHLSNEAANLNNFSSTADYWSFPFESSALELDLEDAWTEIKPLYELLHAYVRRRLREYYGPERISRQAPLPSHILGNMWGQSWSNIFDITQPYPGQHFLDVSPEMLKQGYTPIDVFRLAEDFFVSLNLSAMPLDFWQGSIFEEPRDRVVLCTPSAWDFCNRRDFRIKMCANVNMKDLITAHHEMAHIHYFMAYKSQPKVFRDGANPAFHEAIGEAIGLSVGTPKHLQALGLVPVSVEDTAVDINYLYQMALDKVAFLPFAFVMDKWRYDVFNRKVGKEEYNCHWHILREQYQGIKPPVLRSEINFDPGSKYHIPANIPYLRYFVSTLLQFQIYRALCQAAGQYVPGDHSKPLHKCDIYRSKEAGNILRQLMEKGSSQSWRDVLFQATGDSRLDGSALREYFRPLEDWLRNENLRTGEFVGWLYDGDYCKQSIETAGLQVTLLTCFLVLLTNLEAALFGDHICQKEITVPTQVPQWELRKQTTRTYQWCMSVPPRCSVYSTRLVNESRISVINVTASIETCCEGFQEQNNVCISMCRNCQHGLCYKGDCICRNGWDGPHCDNSFASTTSVPTTASALPTSDQQSELTLLTQIAFTTASTSFSNKEFEAKETAEDIFAQLATAVEDPSLKSIPPSIEAASAELEGSGSTQKVTLHAQATESVPKHPSTFFLESDAINLEVDGDIFQEEIQPSTPSSPVSVLMKPITKGHEEENAILKDNLLGGRYEKRASVETLTQNTKLSFNKASNTHLIYSICAASLVSFLLLVTAITLYAVRSSRKKIENAKRSSQEVATVAVYTSSIFHSPLPDPPVFDNPTYLVAGPREPHITQAEVGTEVQKFNVAYPKVTKPPISDSEQYFYDHPPLTGSYRASSEVDSLSQYNVSQKYMPASSLEPVYDEIPPKTDDLEAVSVEKDSSSRDDPHCLYMNTCGRTKL